MSKITFKPTAKYTWLTEWIKNNSFTFIALISEDDSINNFTKTLLTPTEQEKNHKTININGYSMPQLWTLINNAHMEPMILITQNTAILNFCRPDQIYILQDQGKNITRGSDIEGIKENTNLENLYRSGELVGGENE